jgi:hypothetical protein
MKMTTGMRLGIMVAGIVIVLALSLGGLSASRAADEAVSVSANDIGGMVASAKGPEAGVWVIAETTALPTKYAKIVVTDDRGRYLLPDLPKATYNVWVRGYGLVDSLKVQVTPGKAANLTAVVAPNPGAAAEYYPAGYWFSLLHVPEKSEFPGTGPKGNGIAEGMKNQEDWLQEMKTEGCWSCHSLGDKATREFPKGLGTFSSSVAAWDRRILSGQAAAAMVREITRLGQPRAIAALADWTDRIAAGELPPAPPRPQGLERNVVVTMWDSGEPKAYFHDAISTDKRNPTVNANGLIYGGREHSSDNISVLDPLQNSVSALKVPVREPNTPTTAFNAAAKPLEPSPYWGEEAIWSSQSAVHSPMFDARGRLWLTDRIRPDKDSPAYCKEGSSHPSAKLFPLSESNRQLAVYDPKTKKFMLIDTCYSTHHLVFAYDANNTLWSCSGGRDAVVGWFNTKMFDETGDAEKSQGWAPIILDTNGNGRQDAYVEPNQPVDPTKDKRIDAVFYSAVPSPLDGSIWGSVRGFPGYIVRLNLGSDPPATTLAEMYNVPWNDPRAPVHGYSERGLDVDGNGIVWVGLASGHLASFDRRKCKGPLNGPAATGDQCPEGWTLYPLPGPQIKSLSESGSAESPYYTWVDQFDTLGLGKNVPIATGNANEALLALLPKTGKFVVLRVPYPMGFYAKGLDGRIDDPKAGWKGRGVWASVGSRAPFHMEGGKGATSKFIHFQLRPDPLAR